MTLEQYIELKEKYTKKHTYFLNLGFDNIAADFKEMISALENIIAEKQGEKSDEMH